MPEHLVIILVTTSEFTIFPLVQTNFQSGFINNKFIFGNPRKETKWISSLLFIDINNMGDKSLKL